MLFRNELQNSGNILFCLKSKSCVIHMICVFMKAIYKNGQYLAEMIMQYDTYAYYLSQKSYLFSNACFINTVLWHIRLYYTHILHIIYYTLYYTHNLHSNSILV